MKSCLVRIPTIGGLCNDTKLKLVTGASLTKKCDGLCYSMDTNVTPFQFLAVKSEA